MTHFILRKDADDFTRELIAKGHDIEIVDVMPEKFSKPAKWFCQICGKMTPHRWNSDGWECMEHSA